LYEHGHEATKFCGRRLQPIEAVDLADRFDPRQPFLVVLQAAVPSLPFGRQLAQGPIVYVHLFRPPSLPLD